MNMMDKTKKICKKILGIIINIIVIFALLIFILTIYCLIQVKVQNKDYANLFGYAFFEINTGSMADTLNIGDAIVVRLTNDVNVGDIVVYKQDNYYITHRIIEKNDDIITTKGDANNVADEKINISQICGKVVKIIPNIDTLRKTFSSPVVLVLIGATFVVIGIAIFSKPKDKMEGK